MHTPAPTTGARPPATAYDAVLCDLDNVVRYYDLTRVTALEQAAGLLEGTTAGLAYAPGLDLPLLLGRITPEEWAEAITAGLTDRVGPERARELGRAMAEAPFRADETVVALLRRVRERVPLVLVTNATLQLHDDLAALGLGDLADHVVGSAHEGVAKPDPAIYRIAAARAGVPVDRCLFVDDRQENVDAALALGMTGVLFREPADLHGPFGFGRTDGRTGGRMSREPGEPDVEVLHGGMDNAGAVVRRGDTVERPAPPHAAALHAHLRALAAQGFDGAPTPLGTFDGGRRERLGHIEGEVAVPPFPAWTWSDDGVLRSVGALLRRLHRASAALPVDRGVPWRTGLADPEADTSPADSLILCHNDVCPEQPSLPKRYGQPYRRTSRRTSRRPHRQPLRQPARPGPPRTPLTRLPAGRTPRSRRAPAPGRTRTHGRGRRVR